MERRARTLKTQARRGPTGKVLLPICRARYVCKSQKSEQSVQDRVIHTPRAGLPSTDGKSYVCYSRYTYLFDSPSMLENTDSPRTAKAEVMNAQAKAP